MEKFDYFEDCTFCQTRIGSRHCLLPFQLTREYTAPSDGISTIMDITEIHMHYGIPVLKNNFEVIQWMRLRPTVDEVKHYAQSVQSRTREWYNSPMQSVGDNFEYQSVNTGIQSQAESSIDKPESKSSQDKDEGIPLYTTMVKSEQESSCPTEPRKVDKGKQTEESIILSQVSPAPEKPMLPKIDNKVRDTEIKLDRWSSRHLIRDLVLAARTAYSLNQNSKSGARNSSLVDSLMFESNILSMAKDNYKPSTRTTLDGSKSISKEIVARHSLDVLKLWERGDKNRECRHCLLNYDFIHISKIDSDGSRIEDCFVRYFNDLINQKFIEDDEPCDILNAVKYQLTSEGYPSTFTWITHRIKFLKQNESQSRKITKGSPPPTFKKLEKPPYPAIDQRLIDHINSHLQVAVNREIERAGKRIPELNSEMKLTKFLFILSSEFLRRNKGWQNENSFTTPTHLSKIEESAEMGTKSNDEYLTFNLIKNIIDEFRRSFKDKYSIKNEKV